jgi:hypothetical protein
LLGTRQDATLAFEWQVEGDRARTSGNRPELSADKAVPILEEVLADGKKLLENPKLSKDAHSSWELKARHWLEKAFRDEAKEVRDVMNAGPSI